MAKRSRSIVQEVKFLPLGDAALTVEFGDSINPITNKRVIAFADHVRKARWNGILDIVPTYRSATIHVNPLLLDVSSLAQRLRRMPPMSSRIPTLRPRTHIVPILYGGEWGPDLQELAAFAKLTVSEVIRQHSSITYRVYMLGFSPGFPYLGIVPDAIAMPRLVTPRLCVPGGSVGIAGNQTGIYPVPTPGGWRIIGRTPMSLYRPDASPPFPLRPGDSVTFKPITPRIFEHLLQTRDVDSH